MGAVGELIRQVLVTQHRPGNKLGEQRNESREINKPPGRFRIPSIDIHHVGNGLEDVEGNADGQDDIRQFQRLTAGADQQVVQAVDTKVGVLEVASVARSPPTPMATHLRALAVPTPARCIARPMK